MRPVRVRFLSAISPRPSSSGYSLSPTKITEFAPRPHINVMQSGRNLSASHGNVSAKYPGDFSSAKNVKLWFTVSLMICCLGAFLNLVTVSVIIRGHKLRHGCGVLISHSLSISALLCIVVYPVYILQVFVKQTVGQSVPGWACIVIQFFTVASSIAMYWAEACIAMNRFGALFFPHRYKSWISNKVLRTAVFAVWVIGLVLALPPTFGFGGRYILVPLGLCSLTTSKPGGELIFDLGIYVPLALVGLSYLAIFIKAWISDCLRRLRVQPTTESTGIHKRVKRRLVLARMLFGSSLWYCMCYLPLAVMVAFYPKIYLASLDTMLWTRTVLACGAAFTPIWYYILGRNYRRGWRELWAKKKTIALKQSDMEFGSRVHIRRGFVDGSGGTTDDIRDSSGNFFRLFSKRVG